MTTPMEAPLKSPLKKGALEFKEFYKEATKYAPSFEVKEKFAKADALVVIANAKNYLQVVKALDKKYSTNLNEVIEVAEFKGKEGEMVCSFTPNSSVKKAFLFLLPKEVNVRELQELGAKISNALNPKFESAIIEAEDLNDEELTQIFLGVSLRNYRCDRYFEAKKEGKGAKLKALHIASTSKTLNKHLEEASLIAKHNMLVRELVNSPALDVNPETYHKLIVEACKEAEVKCTVLDEKKMEELGMFSLLSVGHGSINRAKTVIMEYKGNPSSSETQLALVGKGVCFDSGGYSIKPAGGMEDMKCDMAGSAVAFSTILLIAKMGLKVNVVAGVGLVENLISGAAYKPGDVLRSMSGQTIEVLNTDAEGRLVLADVLYYTQKNYNPKYMVDLATLTGAVTVALADVYAGLMYNNPKIAEMIENAMEQTGELAWRLPFRKEYDDMINSSLADMKNIGSARGAGTITAGQFLKRFVNYEKGQNAAWAHLDIAGVAFDGKGGADPKTTKGGTGWGVNLLYKMAKDELAK